MCVCSRNLIPHQTMGKLLMRIIFILHNTPQWPRAGLEKGVIKEKGVCSNDKKIKKFPTAQL